MIFPSADIIEGKVGSRYTLVILAAKRAKQIKEGAPLLIDTDSTNPLTIALEEIAAGMVTVTEAQIVEAPAAPRPAASLAAQFGRRRPRRDCARHFARHRRKRMRKTRRRKTKQRNPMTRTKRPLAKTLPRTTRRRRTAATRAPDALRPVLRKANDASERKLCLKQSE